MNKGAFPKCARMTKILFLCHGNICRSPMAEFVMKDMALKAGFSVQGSDGETACFQIASAATTTEEIGHGIYPPALRTLKAHGIGTPDNELGVSRKRARLMTREDYAHYDMIIGMDEENMRDMMRFYKNDPDGKLFMLMDFAGKHREVADPWYTRDFEATWQDVCEGCSALLQKLT